MTSSQSSSAAPSLARLTFDGGSYDGLALNLLPHSFGVLKMADGSRFVGQWDQGNFVLGQATRPGDLKCTGEFGDGYKLHGLGSSVNFLGLAQDGDYHQDNFKAACTLPPDHIAHVRAAIADAETKCAEAQHSAAVYTPAAAKAVKNQGGAARSVPSANTQAQIDAAAAAHEELARRVAQADAAAAHGPRMLELQAMVDGFAAADRQFLQLPGGMANWERGYIHEYAGTKGLHHPTTEVSPGDRRITLAKAPRSHDQMPVVRPPAVGQAIADSDEAPELFMDNIFTLDVMEEPVIATDGFTYEKRCILEWFRTKRTSPTTGAVLTSTNLIPNHSLKSQINQWREGQVRRNV